MMDLVNLESFVAVYESMSFTRAAEKSFISQPTLSKRIKLLEEEVGCCLFDRSGGSVVPTPAGKLLYKEAQKILQQEAQAKEKMRRFRTGIAGTLHVGMTTVLPVGISVPAVSYMSRKHPDVEIIIESTDKLNILNLFAEGVLDVGVMLEQDVVDMDGVRRDTILKSQTRILVGRGHKLYEKDMIRFSDLRGEAFVCYHMGHPLTISKIIQSLSQSGVKPKNIVYCNSINEYLMYLATGNFFGTYSNVANELASCVPGILRLIPLEGWQLMGHHSAYCGIYDEKNMFAREFMDCLKRAAIEFENENLRNTV